FSSLNIQDHFDSYVIVGFPWVHVKCSVPQDIPTGYLFLCYPYRALGNEVSEEDIAYWSLDPMGYIRLSTQEARARGFPNLAISKGFNRYSWNASVYEEIRTLQIAKGFDPDSQDMARSLGYPLFELI
ncbi:hypothetical protein C8F01DRAFT_1353716, partial [Mycena amicta]